MRMRWARFARAWRRKHGARIGEQASGPAPKLLLDARKDQSVEAASRAIIAVLNRALRQPKPIAWTSLF
jgi:hypothetical protein